MSDIFVVKSSELNNENFLKLKDREKIIFNRLKADYESEGLPPDEIHNMSLILSIFAIFNPDNLPMSENEIQKIFTEFQTWNTSQNKIN